MSELIDLTDNQPALLIKTHDGNYHCVSFSSLRMIANGKYPPSNLGDDVLRMIIHEYVKIMEK
ncbi:MAG TPA: hypothetical protein VJU85_05140 [Nitrososphaeraceae archaeon]|nr:hypothetical protein [Nitrososphaeraceae archaeon]